MKGFLVTHAEVQFGFWFPCRIEGIIAELVSGLSLV
jgi:hypothetical protein